MKVRLHKFQAGGSIIASTFQPITVTPGAYAPSLQQAEQSIAMAIQSGTQSGGSSKGSSDELTKKDLIESLKGIEGLPSDVNFVIDKISKDLSMAEILKNPITGESPINISDAYLKSIQYLNQVKNSKNTFDNAYKSATQNGSINEAAVTSSGLLVVKDSEGKMNTVSAQDYLKNQDFWNEVNAGCDQYSIPKQIAVDLINMHQARGDQIYFITGRTAGDKDGVTPVLQKAFNIKDMHPVEFMGGRKLPTKYNKTPGIIEHKVSIHYGDSDDDILAAKEAGIRGIRLMRAANSTYQPMPTLGGYGEEVLINSNY